MTTLLVVLGVLFIVVAVIYFRDSAARLPSFFPGHAVRSAHRHTKHGIAALIVGVLCLVGAWLSTGRKTVA